MSSPRTNAPGRPTKSRAALRHRVGTLLGPAQLDESRIAHASLGKRRGLMLDVGAHFGASLAPFAEDGWSIHAFEPDPANRSELESAYGMRPNVTIVPTAVSDEAGEMPLYTSATSTGVSSLTPFTGNHAATASVPVITMGEYLAQAGITSVDYMKIDVEGFEQHVLRGYDWSIKPEMIVLEFEDAKTVPLGYSWKDLADELVDRGYEVLVSEWYPVEQYGVAHRWRRMKRYPTELVAADGWGNLIAANTLEQVIPAARRTVRRCNMRRRVDRSLATVQRRNGSTRTA